MNTLLRELSYGARVSLKQTVLTMMIFLPLVSGIYAIRAEKPSSTQPIAFTQTTAPPAIDVRLINDEAEAVLAILAKRDAQQNITDADWRRVFSSEGYVRLKQRETAMKYSFEDEEFRTFVLSDRLAAQRQALADTLAKRLKTVAGGLTTVNDFENSVTRNMQKAGVTGLSVAILNDNQVVYTRQFGWKDKDAGTKLDDTTVFAGASLSKTVFAYLVMVLAEEGILALDKPIQQYLAKPLPEYPEYSDLAGDDRYRTITARMLLSHTGGFPNLRSMSKDGRLRIEFEPGSRFSYSGEGIGLLQKVVESVTHKDLETIAREKVFTPFGMSHTSFVWREAFAKNVAAPHNEFEWAADPDRPVIAHAGGSLTTTAHDYARFIAGILTAKGGRRQSVERMLAPAIRINSRRMFDPVKPADSNANDAIRLSWGLGWGVFETPQGQAFFHTGHSSSAQNYAVVYRKRGIGIVLLSNSANFESVAPEIVAAGIGDSQSPFDWLGYVPFDPAKRKAAPPRRRAIQVAADVIAPYAGKYQIGQGGPVIFIKAEGGRLYVSDESSPWDEVHAESHSVFFAKGRDLAIEFKKGADGKVTHMEIIGGGTTIHARRIE